MPKRIGYITEKVLTLENCTAAVLEGTQNLQRTKKIRKMRKYPEVYGKKILDILTAGWVPAPVREKTINESSSHKTRKLRIPSTLDHLVHVAIMRPIIPELIKRYDFYSCGSVPDRGPKRACNSIKDWMSGPDPKKHAATADVHHAYASTAKHVVMASLRSFIKDERYLLWHELILDQMGGYLAIGFQPSHWYFNLVMSPVDRLVREKCRGIKLVRYMDNYDLFCNRKRTLHKAIRIIMEETAKRGLSINPDWQVFKTKNRPVAALSYRFSHGYTLMRKQVMYNITKSIKRSKRMPCAHIFRGMMSHIGTMRHCNSYNYRTKFLYHNLSIKQMKGVISRADKKCLLCGTA